MMRYRDEKLCTQAHTCFCPDTASCFDPARNPARREMQEESLTDMNETSPRRLSHPREVHLLPLLVASGAGGDAVATKL